MSGRCKGSPGFTTSRLLPSPGIASTAGFRPAYHPLTIALGRAPAAPGMVDVLDDWSSDRFVFVGCPACCWFPPATWPLGRLAGPAPPFATRGTPTGSPAAYLEGCNFLTAAVEHPGRLPCGQTACCALGPGSPGAFVRWCSWGGSWPFVALHGAFSLIGFIAASVRDCSPGGHPPYNAIAFSGPIAVFVGVF